MQQEFDVIVVGSGAGALLAAIRASDEGLTVLVIEKTPLVGGTSAISGGGIWIPDNQDMRKISAWVAIIAVPTMVFGIYGMNFTHMPELEWTFGYPLVLVLLLAVCGAVYTRFKKAGWL